jgi:triosephosphate isomerase
MAAEAGAQWALAGHSERRHGFGETDLIVARKAAAAFEAGLLPVVCVGETLEERQAGQLEAVLSRQLGAVLELLPPDRLRRLVLAYEPVWAIGTGVNATPSDASSAHAVLRGMLGRRLGAAHTAAVPILYGGSVKPDNAAALLAAEGVDGLLVGGASLDPAGFAMLAGVDTGLD